MSSNPGQIRKGALRQVPLRCELYWCWREKRWCVSAANGASVVAAGGGRRACGARLPCATTECCPARGRGRKFAIASKRSPWGLEMIYVRMGIRRCVVVRVWGARFGASIARSAPLRSASRARRRPAATSINSCGSRFGKRIKKTTCFSLRARFETLEKNTFVGIVIAVERGVEGERRARRKTEGPHLAGDRCFGADTRAERAGLNGEHTERRCTVRPLYSL